MAIRRTRCPECQSYEIEVLEELNPDTTDMNMRVRLRCDQGHEWEGRITSHHHHRLRAKGQVI